MVVLKCGWAPANTCSFSSHSSMQWNCLSLSLSALVFVEMTELIRFNCGKHARFIHFFALSLIIINHLLPCYSHTLKWICNKNGPAKRMQCEREKLQLWRRQGRFIWHSISFSMHFIIFILIIYCILVCTLHSQRNKLCAQCYLSLCEQKQYCWTVWVEQRKTEKKPMWSVLYTWEANAWQQTRLKIEECKLTLTHSTEYSGGMVEFEMLRELVMCCSFIFAITSFH